MSDIIAAIKKMDIDTGSHFEAQRSIQKKWPNLQKRTYEDLIKELTGLEFLGAHIKESELVFNYLVVDAVKAYNESQIDTYEAHLEGAKAKAAAFLAKNGWIICNGETEATTNEVTGEVTNPSGPKTSTKRSGATKKEQAVEVFKEVDGMNKSRKELIEIFKQRLGLTEGGASTYVHNCKKGIWA